MDDLSLFFRTTLEAKDFSNRLSQVASKLYETNFQLEKALSEAIGVNKKEAFMALLRDNNIDETSLQAIKTVLDGMQKYITSLPVLSITLAFEPTDETLRILSEWCSFTIKKQLLFDIEVSKKVIAGGIIHYNGKYKDYSIVPTFQKILEEVLTTSMSSSENTVSHG